MIALPRDEAELVARARRGSARWCEGEPIAAAPRGFYLRAKLPGAILRDGFALP